MALCRRRFPLRLPDLTIAVGDPIDLKIRNANLISIVSFQDGGVEYLKVLPNGRWVLGEGLNVDQVIAKFRRQLIADLEMQGEKP